MIYGPLDWKRPQKIKAGTEVRKSGETLPWTVLEITDDRVVLSGPGKCLGTWVVTREEFDKGGWGRA